MSNNNRTSESLLARLALAEKATPGPWANNDNVERLFGRKPHDWWVVYADFCGIKGAQILQCSMYGATEAEQIESRKKEKMCDPGISGCNAAHIAANDPSTVIADIEEILRLREEVERLRREVENLSGQADRGRQKRADQLDREAAWLAQRMVSLCECATCHGCLYFPEKDMDELTVTHWREAARKAVEKK